MTWFRDRVALWLVRSGLFITPRDHAAMYAEMHRMLESSLLPENFNMRLHGTEGSLRLIEKRLEALEMLAGPDGQLAGLAGKKTADLLEAAAALRRDKSAAEARGVDLEIYLEERKRRPPPPPAPEAL